MGGGLPSVTLTFLVTRISAPARAGRSKLVSCFLMRKRPLLGGGSVAKYDGPGKYEVCKLATALQIRNAKITPSTRHTP